MNISNVKTFFVESIKWIRPDTLNADVAYLPLSEERMIALKLPSLKLVQVPADIADDVTKRADAIIQKLEEEYQFRVYSIAVRETPC